MKYKQNLLIGLTNIGWFSAWTSYVGVSRGIRSNDFQFSIIILSIIVILQIIVFLKGKEQK